MLDARELIGKRVLISGEKNYYDNVTVTEAKILEVSPSGNWVKIMNMHGNKYWKERVKVMVVETLEAKPERPEGENDVK